jgi:hypothetical protein
MKTYTKEEKNQYFKDLRARWNESKALSKSDESAKAIWREASGKVSYISFWMTLTDMQRLGLDGVPYVDCKTFGGWRSSGFKVKKGEKSKISGITWMGVESKEETDHEDLFVYPKVYHLFHRTQVEKLGVK